MADLGTAIVVKVLLAEGTGPAEDAIRDLIEAHVGLDLAWDVHETSDALRLIEEAHPSVAVFSHSLMKADLLPTIQASTDKSPLTKVLVISMHNDSRFALRAIEAGASGYMLYDRAFEELVHAVNVVMSGRTYLSPGIAGIERGLSRAPKKVEAHSDTASPKVQTAARKRRKPS